MPCKADADAGSNKKVNAQAIMIRKPSHANAGSNKKVNAQAIMIRKPNHAKQTLGSYYHTNENAGPDQRCNAEVGRPIQRRVFLSTQSFPLRTAISRVFPFPSRGGFFPPGG